METAKIIRKPLKQAAKQVLKKHYWLLIVVCMFASIIGVGSTDVLSFLGSRVELATKEEGTITSAPSLNVMGMIDAILSDNITRYEESAAASESQLQKEGIDVLGLFRLSSSKGFLSAIVNKMSSGGVYVLVFSAVRNITQSASFAKIFFIVAALLISLAFFAFVSNVYRAVSMRIFLESRIYRHVPVSRFLFFFRVKRYLKAVLTMLIVFIFQLLWNITIIGGIIKRYSYSQVPFIVAENPDISPLKAITLSRRMMNGHKWERFVLDLSFIPWDLLNAVTIGVLGLFFLDAYETAVFAEYYSELRADHKTRGTEGAELLNDRFLFETAEPELIDETYADLIELSKTPDREPFISQNKVKVFFAKWFGIVPSYNNDEDRAYRAHQIRKHKLERLAQIRALELYPGRLYPIPEKERDQNIEDLGSSRCYSISSIILLFFSLCLVGWLWEVTLHLVTEGIFVNRGTLHGPWLPIYGAGSVMIILLLRRLRSIPWLEFAAAVVLCGIVEYFSHWYLELTKGAKWWDYTGYLLNLNGRICAEGLFVFGLGGIAVVYLLAPFLDNFFRKIGRRVLIIICVVLITVFAADLVYSHYVPNMGRGITDYEET